MTEYHEHSNSLKGGGDAVNMAGAESQSGNTDSAGVGVGTGVLGSVGAGFGGGLGASGDAFAAQCQHADGGDVLDNTSMNDVGINS
jgi:hypothetical protein